MNVTYKPIQTNNNYRNKSKQQVSFKGENEILRNLANALEASQVYKKDRKILVNKDMLAGSINAYMDAATHDLKFPEFLANGAKFANEKIKTIEGTPTLRELTNFKVKRGDFHIMPEYIADGFKNFSEKLETFVKEGIKDKKSPLYGQIDAPDNLKTFFNALKSK